MFLGLIYDREELTVVDPSTYFRTCAIKDGGMVVQGCMCIFNTSAARDELKQLLCRSNISSKLKGQVHRAECALSSVAWLGNAEYAS